MTDDAQISKLVNGLSFMPPCQRCGTRFRFGDVECPHCGEDLEPVLRRWAEWLLEQLAQG